MRYYISDLHFYHESLLTKMDCRGFENCDKMHEYMIERWNKKVRENDEVVILGDVSMERGKKTNDILQQLNGRLFLVQGNHDNYLEDRRFDATIIKERLFYRTIQSFATMGSTAVIRREIRKR